MAYGYRRKTRMVAVKPKTTPRKYSTPRKNYSKKPKVTFTAKVQKIIASNVENKYTNTLTYNDGVARTDAASAYSFFTWSPGQDATGSRLFNLENGLGEGNRIGNDIKLKRWIIKGIIQPVRTATDVLVNSNVGYVDVYFGKLMKNTTQVANTLSRLYQNGNTATTPACKSTDMLNPLNKDTYKVYYHRRFKMGAASDPDTYSGTAATAAEHPASNDFKLSQTFGFDVCKYILKNKQLKYDDGLTTASPFIPPNNADIVNLTLWATYTPQTGQATGVSSRSLYSIDALSYAEYEDA